MRIQRPAVTPVLSGSAQIDHQIIVDFVRPEEEDIVILGGTLVEGIGNCLSDLDVCVLTNRRRTFSELKDLGHQVYTKEDLQPCQADNDFVFETTNYYPESTFCVDVEYWLEKELNALLGKIDALYEQLTSHPATNWVERMFSRHQALLLHRILTGNIIFGSSDFQGMLRDRYASKYSYILYRKYANDYWPFRDVVGAYLSQNRFLACELAREYLIREIRASLHLNGNTNDTRKWFFDYFTAIPSYKSYHQRATALLCSVDASNPHLYITDVFSLIEDIEEVNRSVLDSLGERKSCARQSRLLAAEKIQREHTPNPILEHEFLFRKYTFEPKRGGYKSLLNWG